MIGSALKEAVNFVYQSYKPDGISGKGVSCWRCEKMCDLLVAFFKYYGYEAARETVVIDGEGHVIVRAKMPAGSVFVDPSVEKFGVRTGPMWGLGAHPDTEEGHADT